MKYETRRQKLASPEVYHQRLWRAGTLGVVMIAFSLAIGIAGYHWIESLGWVDAFLNAAMILSGMGPVNVPKSEAGKIFAGFYALYSGLAVLAIAAVVFAPVIHRILHRFHIEEGDKVGDA